MRSSMQPARAGRWSLASVVLLAAAVLTAAPRPAAAQYFGRNKVQYENFDWRILNTPHWDLYFYDGMEEITRRAARMAERWYVRDSVLLDFGFDTKQLIFYANHPDFQQTNVISGLIEEGTGGVTEGLRTRVIMPFTGVNEENNHVLGHEIVHVFQYQLAEKHGGLQRLSSLPLWMIEGMAEYLSVGRTDPNTAMWMRDAVLRNDLPTLEQLTRDPRYFPYRYGLAFWAFVGGRWGDDQVRDLFTQSLQVGPEAAFPKVLGMTAKQFSEIWAQQIREDYLPLVRGRQLPREVGDLVIGQGPNAGTMSVSPVQSPDGRWVAFFARRDLFTVDLYVANAFTGEVVKRLTSPAYLAHYDNLSFIYSAAAWSPDGRRMAYITYDEGDNAVAILDVESGDIVHEIDPPGIEAMSFISWSPDGRTLAISGNTYGTSDLYLYDLQTNQTRQLTNDAYSDIHPEWSPDGQWIAVATDRGEGTDFERLTFRPMRLALVNAATGEIRLLPALEGSKMINPQWSGDGQSLYFVSDRNGFQDIYRLHLPTSEIFQITRITTGISGITALSPAISVAPRTGRIVFSVFTDQGYSLYALDAQRAIGVPIEREYAVELALAPPAAILPPIRAFGQTDVSTLLHTWAYGLPPDTITYPVAEYDPDFRLDAIGQPTLGVASGPLGTALGGGVSFLFGDQLSNQRIGVALQVEGELGKDFGGQVYYLNAENRWNWALGGGRIPYRAGFAGATPTIVEGPNGEEIPATLYQQVLRRVYIDEAEGTAIYPFSATRRAEFAAGGVRLSYDTEVEEVLVVGGRMVDRRRFDADDPDPLAYGRVSAALVHDNSFFGFTSPALGSRWRFEAGGTYGGVDFAELLADYRRYHFWRPFTFAWRGLHYGRYLGDADGNRLQPLFLGDPNLVRGYEVGGFDVAECSVVPEEPQSCPEFERLLGSRVAVLSAEFRIPLFGTRELGLIRTGFLPVEVAPFVDAGVAWTAADAPRFAFDREASDRVPVVSAGVTTRVNLFGSFIGELYWAYPFMRDVGWEFGFQLAPGW